MPNVVLCLISLILILIVSENGESDWYNYRNVVWTYDLQSNSTNYGEPIYSHIVRLVNKNYLLFRLIVWGGAFVLTVFSFKRFAININVAVFFILAAFLIKFNYSRSTLAMACYYLGLSFILKPIKKNFFLSIFLAFLFFWGAYEFHHSLLPVLLLSIVAFLPLNKPIVLIPLLFLLPFIASFITKNVDILDYIEDEYSYNRLQGYLERESVSVSFFGIIANVISYGAFVLPIVLISFSIIKKNRFICPSMLRLWRVMFAVSCLAVSFLFMGFSSSVFTYRYLFMTFIPISVLSVYLYQNRLMGRARFILFLSVGVLSNLYPLLYGIYKLG